MAAAIDVWKSGKFDVMKNCTFKVEQYIYKLNVIENWVLITKLSSYISL